MSSRRTASRTLGAVLLCAGPAFAGAQTSGVEARASDGSGARYGEQGNLRLRYGPVFANGSYQDTGPGLSYTGMTPDDAAVSGELFGGFPIGGGFSVERDGFSLSNAGTRVTSGALWRAEVGPEGKLQLGPFRIQLLLGYGFAQLPEFGDSTSPGFQVAQRHSLMIASRAHLDLPYGALLEAHGEYPVALDVADARGAGGATGFTAGGAVGWRFVTSGSIAYAALVDYEYVTDRLTTSDHAISSQSLSRLGLVLQVSWVAPPPGPPPPPSGPGVIQGHVVLDDVQGPARGVSVQSAGHEAVVTDSAGDFKMEKVGPGDVQLSITVPGYKPLVQTVTVPPGGETTASLSLHKPVGPGTIRGVVFAFDSKAPNQKSPAGGVSVVAGTQTLVTAGDGSFTVEKAGPGPVSLNVSAKGFKTAQELVAVPPEAEATLEIVLQPAAVKPPAVIRGLVRSTAGKPLRALVNIPEAQIHTTSGADGRFLVHLPGGRYTVSISVEGFISQSKVVSVADGDQALYEVDLQPANP